MSNDNRIITRCAPMWAWDLIDETLHLDSTSKAFDKNLRDDIATAMQAMLYASENPDIQELASEDIPKDF